MEEIIEIGKDFKPSGRPDQSVVDVDPVSGSSSDDEETGILRAEEPRVHPVPLPRIRVTILPGSIQDQARFVKRKHLIRRQR